MRLHQRRSKAAFPSADVKYLNTLSCIITFARSTAQYNVFFQYAKKNCCDISIEQHIITRHFQQMHASLHCDDQKKVKRRRTLRTWQWTRQWCRISRVWNRRSRISDSTRRKGSFRLMTA